MSDTIDHEKTADASLAGLERLIDLKAKSRVDFLSLGEVLSKVKHQEAFRRKSFSDFEGFMKSIEKEVGKRSTVYGYIDAYETFIEKLEFSREWIRTIGISKLEVVLGHAGKGEKTKALYKEYLDAAERCRRSRLKRELELIDEDEDEPEIMPTQAEAEEFSKSVRKVTNPDEAKAEIERLSDLMKNSPVKERRINATILARHPDIAKLVKEKAGYVCQICGAQPFLTKRRGLFAEAHHIYELAKTRIDDPQQMQCLCPTCHRVVHFGSEAARIERQNLAKPRS